MNYDLCKRPKMTCITKTDDFEHLLDRYTHFEGLIMIIILYVNLGRKHIHIMKGFLHQFTEKLLIKIKMII